MSLSFCHINARSLMANFAGFKLIVYNKYDVITVSETWLNDNIPDAAVSLDGYKLYRRDRAINRGGGLAVYVKSVFKSKIISRLEINTSEQLWLSINHSNKNIAIATLYRPPNFRIVDFLEEFETSLSFILPQYDDILCAGDLNIDLLVADCASSKLLNDLLDSCALRQVVEQPTRYGPTSAKLLDLIICSDNIKPMDVTISDISEISDHCLVSCKIGNTRNKTEPFLYTFRDFNNFNPTNLKTDIMAIDFSQILYLDDINLKLHFLNSTILELFNRHAPIKTVRISKKKAPWLTEALRQLMSRRDKALAKYKKTKVAIHWNYYKNLRNEVNYAIKREKKAYLEYKISLGNSKNMWKVLKSLDINVKYKTELPNHLLNSTTINNFFIRSSQCGNNIPDPDTLLYYSNNKLNVDNFEFSHSNDLEIYDTLLSIKSKAVGEDLISIDMLLHCCPIILPYITHIFNYCIECKTFPSIWKRSQIIPLPKVTNPDELKDLRPISILCTLSKAFEKIIERQIRQHLHNHNILPEHQSGFRAGHSCTTALAKVTDDLFSAIDNNQLCILVLLDYSRAFDTISHELLLAVMHYIGFSLNAVALLRSYLIDRSQCVVLKNEKSGFSPVICGVPQGSILGPLLFTLYTFEFCKTVAYCTTHFYADDTQMYYAFEEKDTQQACQNINEDLQSLLKISSNFCLNINATKSKAMLFGRTAARNRVSSDVNISVNNETIDLTDSAKNLGLILDYNLKFSAHVSSIVKKSYCSLKLIYANRHILNRKTKIILCEALVLSHLNYVDVVYGPCLRKTDARRLQLIQNSCVRLICGLRKRDHVSSRLNEIGWLNVEKRRVLHCGKFYHKIITTKTPQYLLNKLRFRTDIHNINIRFKNILTPPQHSTTLYQSSFTYNAAKVYNKIPNDLKQLNVHSFSKELKKLLIRDTAMLV